MEHRLLWFLGNCEFTQIGANAVFIDGDFDAPNSNITVKNNLVAHYGRRFFNAIPRIL